MKRLATSLILLFIASWGYAQNDLTIYRKNGKEVEMKNATTETRGGNVYITDGNNKTKVYFQSSLDSITGLPEGVLYFNTVEKNDPFYDMIIVPKKVPEFKISEKHPRLVGQSTFFRQDNISTQEGYNIVKKWINFTYDNPNVVIKSEIENEYIRIRGSADVCWASNVHSLNKTLTCFNQYHTLTFEFKNDEIKFKIFQLEMTWLPGKWTSSGNENYNPTYNDMQMSNMRKRKEHTDAAAATLAYLNEYANEIENLIKKSMTMTSDKALAELKRQKDKLDLEIISQAEYDSIKAVLIKYIK